DRALHPARDGAGLERGPQVRAVVRGRGDGPGGPRRGGHGAGLQRGARARRSATHPGGRRRDRGGHPARRHRLPVGLGRPHAAARGSGVRALRDDQQRPAGHRPRPAARGGHRPAAGQVRRARRRPARPRAGAPRHRPRRSHARHPRRADDLGPPRGGPRLRHGPQPRPPAPGARGGGRGQDQRCGGHLLERRPAGRAAGRGAPRADPGARRHAGGAARRHQRVGLRPGGDRHRLRGVRAGGAARAAHRGPRAVGAVRQGPEGLERDAPQEEPDRQRAHRRHGADRARAGGAGDGGHPAVARARHQPQLDRAHRAARRLDRHRLPAPPDDPAGDRPGRRRRPHAGQPRELRWPDLHQHGAARARGGRAVARGRVRVRAAGGDAHVGDRHAVPGGAERRGAGRRSGARRGPAGRGVPPRALPGPAGPGLRPPRRPHV
ncbi:MAG: Adenylosuccinate lyase @ SAICAR lyase, partial [uncultured Frankineae bacterium]